MTDILLAVSGGVDSMYLLNKAPELFPETSFAVAHCNFSLRGEESDRDESFVATWCREHGMECFIKHFDTLSEAESRGISIEMAARELRYGWFAALCNGTAAELEGRRSHGFDAVATAHNANDCAETLFLNLLRGCGVGGLRGIQAVRTDSDGLTVIRPLLELSRENIRSWMEKNGHLWCEDSTNAETDCKRNKIRNLVFPVFREMNPSFIETLTEDMKFFAEADDIAGEYCMEASKKIIGGDGAIDVHLLLEYRHWKYVLWSLVSHCGFSRPTYGKLTELLERYRIEPRGTVTLGSKVFQSHTHILKIKNRRIYVTEKEDRRPDGSRSER